MMARRNFGGGPLDPAWYSGPTSDLPLTAQHDRTILAMAFNPSNADQVVTASADHGLRLYNLRTGKQIRQLFSKRYGHTDWVTTVSMCQDGRVVSGSMDKQLCLWDRSAVRCSNLVGHNGSISKVMVDDQNVAVSGAYDSSLLVWRLDGLECVQGLFNGHSDAVMEFAWKNSLAVSGDRKGGLAFWDINRPEPLKKLNGHAGAVSKINLYSDDQLNNLVLSVGQRDGKLNIFDMRTSQSIKSSAIHRGAINFLQVNPSTGQIVTGSSDREIKVHDLRGGSGSGLATVTRMQSTDAVFCGELLADGNLCIVGCGDGNIVAFDLARNGECLYGYGCDNVGAVHCIGITPDRKGLVTGGDSGQGLKLCFGGF